jgi:hypothetical protein
MMKTISILLSLFTIITIGAKLDWSQNSAGDVLEISCPDKEPFDWVVVNLFLTSDRHDMLREELGLTEFVMNEDEFNKTLSKHLENDPQTEEDVIKYWNTLGDYWSTEGVKHVNGQDECKSISTALKLDIHYERLRNEYSPRAYYSIGEYYFIVFNSNQPGFRTSPARILSKEFEILEAFGM